VRDDVYAGPLEADAPDVIVGFRPGYRMGWQTAVGGVSANVIEPNEKHWAGDHIMDAAFVPGTVMSNLPFELAGAGVCDIAPTVLALMGVPHDGALDGRPLAMRET